MENSIKNITAEAVWREGIWINIGAGGIAFVEEPEIFWWYHVLVNHISDIQLLPCFIVNERVIRCINRNTLLLLSLFTAINCCYLNSLSSS